MRFAKGKKGYNLKFKKYHRITSVKLPNKIPITENNAIQDNSVIFKEKPKSNLVKVAAIVTCVDYVDVFEEVVESWHAAKFGHVIVCTAEDDLKTIRFCKKHRFRFVTLKRDKFVRGRYLNAGIEVALQLDVEWLVTMDCDTYLPKISHIDLSSLNKEGLYGIGHINVDKQGMNLFKSDKILPNKKKYKPCFGPFQMFSKNLCIRKTLRHVDTYNVKNGKGASAKFTRLFKPRLRKTLTKDYIVCLNIGAREGRR